MRREEIRDWIRKSGQFSFSRSGGPGGQNVNKLNTKAVLRLPVLDLPVGEGELARVRLRLDSRLTVSGELVIHSSEGRSQKVNRELAEERALMLIVAALRKPKHRKPTQPSRAARERRLTEKRRHGEIKRRRRAPDQE